MQQHGHTPTDTSETPTDPLAAPVSHPMIERARTLVRELGRQVDPEMQVTLREALHIVVAWGGHERHVELPAARLATLTDNPEPLRLDIEAAVQDLRQQGPAMPTDEPRDLSDHEVLDRTKELARHIVSLLDAEATLAFEEYRWHGEMTLDIIAALHGHEQHLEVSVSRARIILPDYEWELRRDDIEDEVLYHDLEELIHDLHRERERAEAVPAGDRQVFDRTKQLARRMVAELDREAAVSFEEYRWHGEPTLDITVSLHGHEHHYQITAGRARIILRDHDILHHDLEGVVHELRSGGRAAAQDSAGHAAQHG